MSNGHIVSTGETSVNIVPETEESALRLHLLQIREEDGSIHIDIRIRSFESETEALAYLTPMELLRFAKALRKLALNAIEAQA